MMALNKQKLLEFYLLHKGEVIGAAIGFLIASTILIIGFFKTLFIVICVLFGFYIGKMLYHDKDYLKNLLDRILPPGTYR